MTALCRDGNPAGNIELAPEGPGRDPPGHPHQLPADAYLTTTALMGWPRDLNPELKQPWMRFLNLPAWHLPEERPHAGRLIVLTNNDQNWLAMWRHSRLPDDHDLAARSRPQ